jgi:hypothetical protein
MYLQENEPLTKKLLLQNQVFNIPAIKKTPHICRASKLQTLQRNLT